MTTHAIKLGVLSREDYAKRSIAIAKGIYTPRRDEPKIWFDSLRSMAETLSNDNQTLLRLIVEKKPQSLAELEQLSGRKKSNLSRTLKMLERHGIVSVVKEDHRLIPTVLATDFTLEFGLNFGGFGLADDRAADMPKA
jgi:predicted transcriptional regulator